MKIKLQKSEVEKQIKEFFKSIKNKTSREIKKMKRIAMNKNIPLREKRKLFCKKCLSPYQGNEKIIISKGMRSLVCNKCDYVNKWKLK